MTPKYLKTKSLLTSEKEKGQSLLEMAFALIVLLLLLAGIVDLGRLFFTYIALREAAQEGAAFASVCPPNTIENKNLITDHVKTSSHFPVNLSSYKIIVSSTFTTQATPGSQIRVDVYYQDFQFIMPFLNLIDGNLQATAFDVSLVFECPD